MSEEGYKKLMAELKELETVERPKISAAIAEARDKGDLSENAEYDAAKEAQGMLEMKINKLKTIIADAKIIDESKLKTDSVQILNKVELKNIKNGMKMIYTIVSESEANQKEGNVTLKCESLMYNSKDNIVVLPQNKLAVIDGLEGYLIAESDNVLLICKKDEEHSIRKYVNDAQIKLGEDYI